MVPWLFAAGRPAPFDAPDVGAALDAVDDELLVVPAAGAAAAGVAFAAAGLVGAADLAVGAAAPPPEAGLAPAPVAGFVVDESGVPGFAGCFGAADAGLAADAPVPALRVVFSRDGVPEPPTVALPTVALPTAADARAEALEF
ncbi:hypothetical protein [Cryptosporangium japonicum]|uniref:Uncharacterized protein n=1 Tax=Cryptosporangium japonicum TaxID=80872 RepID=A0ABN0V2U9_9ACTN